MAKILIIDSDGVGLSFAWRCAQAGHEVRWYLADKPSISPKTGDNFKGITKVKNWVSHVMWADLVFPTSNDRFLERLDFFRAKGAKVFGPTVASAKLEISRKTGMEVLERAGIEIAPFETFKNMKEALRYVISSADRFVFKTLGDNEDKALTYVSKNAADLANWMERIIELKEEPKGEVMVQKFIEGIEMGVSRWMGSSGWVGQWNDSFEHKKLMSGNYGYNTGEMGTIAAFTSESKLGTETLAKLEGVLLSLGHRGDAALGFIIDKAGQPWPTEWTCRPGWPIFNLMLGATKEDPAKWMIDALGGSDTTSFREDIGCCLVALHGKLDDAPPETASNVPIYGITRGSKKHLHPQAVKINVMRDMDGGRMVQRPIWNTTGEYALVVTGFGKDVKQAASRAYGTVEQLHLSNMAVRDDVGEELKKQLPLLHKMGYATHFNYEG